MKKVAGIDSSTQSCKVTIRDAETGVEVRSGAAPHPPGTEVEPAHWWRALLQAIERAGGLEDVLAVSVSGQQHGMVCLAEDGAVVRPALLWNDTRSARAAAELTEELGAAAWAEAVGSVPLASLTVSKLRWLAEHEPENARRTAAVALPHDWLTWKLRGTGRLSDLATDRSDASGTGYFDAPSGNYRRELVARALGDTALAESLRLPVVLGPDDAVGPATAVSNAPLLGPGSGDNAGAALGLGLAAGETLLSIGTSGVVATVSARPTADASGLVTGFSDATGVFLPLACTLNGSRVLDSAARLLGVDHAGLSDLALAAEPGAGGLVLVPYLEGERTPNLPDASGTLHGMTLSSLSRENYARAAVEGLAGLMAYGLDALRNQGVQVDRVTLVGGAARSAALCQIMPAVLGLPVAVPSSGEYVAIGAARQAAWVLTGARPQWVAGETAIHEVPETPQVRERYLEFAACS
ncbi:xylulokinase [Enemella evansiae]|uniref:xylulokinase n=1 Tax=Enemella evansiae TaxID=2016499 RepID=UPI00105D9CA2|nr:FGGY family carbohydrate kinase [Enemella evansiae]TDO89887.1 xylulokinase [Enemella evansiae]